MKDSTHLHCNVLGGVSNTVYSARLQDQSIGDWKRPCRSRSKKLQVTCSDSHVCTSVVEHENDTHEIQREVMDICDLTVPVCVSDIVIEPLITRD